MPLRLRLQKSLLAAGLSFGLTGTGTAGETPDSARPTQWDSGSGPWTEASGWSHGLPTPFSSAIVGGSGDVVVSSGLSLASDLKVGLASGDRARVEVNGGRLVLTQDSLRVGERSGGAGEFILRRGAMHCVMDVFVGAASSLAGRATNATLDIQGGSFLGRTLTVGLGWGAHSRVAIEGSRASAVHVLDYVYFEGFADPGGQPGRSTLAFTLDEHGVTPITIQSRRDGLRIIRDAASQCRLEIGLSAVPPRDDVTLVASQVPVRGTFTGLPEGAEITAPFGGRTYRWMLTYRGGAGGHNLVLKNRSRYADGAPVTQARAIPAAPAPLWRDHPIYPLAIPEGAPAFPGAEGYGAFTPGGRNGRILTVENLRDSGPGSLRAAVEAAGPRKVRFTIGGTIPLNSTLIIGQPFLTLDGREAPGGGITLRGHGIEVRTHDVILRYFRIRVGDEGVKKDDPSYLAGVGDHAVYFVEGSKNCIADHLSLSWTSNKILSVTKMSDLVTVQWCILSESLNFAGHGYASIAGGNRQTWHHNLFAHNESRNVRFQGPVDADFRNNVIYDWGDTAAYGEFDRVNYVGNYLKAGPSTTQEPRLFHNGDEVVAPGSLFVAGNILEGAPRVNQDNWKGMGYWPDRAVVAAPAPFPAPPVATESAEAAFGHVLQGAGATLPRRDSIDERIVREVRTGTGHIVKSVEEAEGSPE